ncbi:MAG: phosphoenolpyruvate synthase, partial [candidate division WOR-3 bacterium]
GVKVPNGFAITAFAYRYFIEKSGLKEKIEGILNDLQVENIKALQNAGKTIRNLIKSATLPDELQSAIKEAYYHLGLAYFKDPDVAVRSSATAEDLPGASFAGQQETYLNIKGQVELIEAVKKCFASLFTDRAISYRKDKGFSHSEVALSVGVQKMVRSDQAASGVAFTLDTESGFPGVVIINSIYGLGEMIVQGRVVPDEFIIFKEGIRQNRRALISKKLGSKQEKMVYTKSSLKPTKIVPVPKKEQNRFSLTDDEALKLAAWCLKIEEHFSAKHNRYQPMDIEWAKDGALNELFIVQARPETIHSAKKNNIFEKYVLKSSGQILTQGIAVGKKIGQGKAKILKSASQIAQFQKGEVLVTEITDPDWEPIMKIASAIVTDKGGRTSHAAIVSRELGIPCIVGTTNATSVLKDKMEITVDCSSGEIGKIYKGILPFEIKKEDLGRLPEVRTQVMVNIGSPDEAFSHYNLPVKGVGLAREEFIIASHIKIHPNLLIDYNEIKNQISKVKSVKKSQFKIPLIELKKLLQKVDELTNGYENKTEYYIDKLAEGIAKIGAAFYPYKVIVRFSDFKTNEYRTLLGGELYEPFEENPMIGWRGASRYYDEKFKAAFGLECKAIKKVRDEFGLKNVIPMIPFCRTLEEAKKTLEIMASWGLVTNYIKNNNWLIYQNDEPTPVYLMCEIPSNVLLADEFLELCDGMSIGSNDLTQLTLGLDRDAGILSYIGNENNEAVKKLIREIIKKCREKNKYIGICGQGPSDLEGFAEFLVKEGIESISLNPDTVIPTLFKISKAEQS